MDQFGSASMTFLMVDFYVMLAKNFNSCWLTWDEDICCCVWSQTVRPQRCATVHLQQTELFTTNCRCIEHHCYRLIEPVSCPSVCLWTVHTFRGILTCNTYGTNLWKFLTSYQKGTICNVCSAVIPLAGGMEMTGQTSWTRTWHTTFLILLWPMRLYFTLNCCFCIRAIPFWWLQPLTVRPGNTYCFSVCVDYLSFRLTWQEDPCIILFEEWWLTQLRSGRLTLYITTEFCQPAHFILFQYVCVFVC